MSNDFTASQFAPTNASASSSSIRWLTEEVFKLIDIVKLDEAIYNPRHKYYFCRPYVENFWREVDLKLEKNPGASLAKWTNLRISFRREYTNYLEEKVPPCWSYFDRMFFLHPYLRKKHQQTKSLDTQVQDALAHLSSLSNRMQRERAVAACTVTAGSSTQQNVGNAASPQSPQPQQLDNYLEYFDEHEHEHNHSELDEIMDEEPRMRFQNPIDNDIKSECEDDYEPEHRSLHQHDEDEPVEREINKTVYDAMTPAPTSTVAASSSAEKRYSQHQAHRLQMNRLQLRSYNDDVRGLRPRSQELHPNAVTVANLQTNISFVRPTFSKPVDMVSTTTHGNITTADAELPSPSNGATATCSSATTSSSNTNIAQRHLSHHQSTQRLETNNTNIVSAAVSNGGVVELCDCKTDPDAMFLMSLLPDIQKLNGRDRGKIKIAFQNILQDYLYPD